MTCADVRDNLSAFLDGELDRESAAHVRAHLASCDACRAELESLRGVVDTLHALPRRPAPPEIEREIVSLLERDALLTRAAEPKRRRFFFTALGGATLAAAGLLLAAGLYLAYLSDADRSDKTTVAMNDDLLSPRANADFEKRAGIKNDAETPGGVRGKYGGDLYKWADKRTEAAPKNAYDLGTAPAAPQMKQKEVVGDVAQGPDFRPPAAPPVDADLARTDRKENLPAPATPTPTKDFGVLDDARKTAEEYRPEPPRPEVLELQFAAADLDAARTRITALADSLNIRTVRAARLGYMAKTEGVAAERFAQTEVAERVKRDTAADTADRQELKDAPAEDGRVRDALNKVAQNSRTDDEYETTVARLLDLIEKPDADADGVSTTAAGAPVVVLAVPEDKLPQLVAKLAADQSGVEGGKLASVVLALPSQTHAGARAEPEKTGTQQKAPDPLDKFMKALDEAAKEDAERERMAKDTLGREGEPGRARSVAGTRDQRPSVGEKTRPTTPAPSVRENEAPNRPGETILAEAAKKEGKAARPARLVYLQIYLSKVSRAAEAAKTNAETAPAAK